LTCDKTNNTDTNGCPVITLANGNQEGTASIVSTSNQATDHRSMNVIRACENVSMATLYRVKGMV
jgi:hypothetical protein